MSAREAYLTASNYYRSAEFFLHTNPSDPRIVQTWQKSVESFRKAALLFASPVEFIEIPYEGQTIPGYFYKVDNVNILRPTLILFTGFDGTQEELYATSVCAAISKGYNCLTFEGPGQGGVIRKQIFLSVTTGKKS